MSLKNRNLSNVTFSNISDEQSHFSLRFEWTLDLEVIFTCLAVVGLSLNIFTLLVHFHQRSYRKVRWIYVIAIIINDICFYIFCLPFVVAYRFQETTEHVNALCLIRTSLSKIHAVFSIFGTALLCLDKWIALRHPYWYLAHLHEAVTAVKIISTVAVIGVIHHIILAFLPKNPDAIDTDLHIDCVLREIITAGIYESITVIIVQVTSITIILFTSLDILLIIRKHRRAIADQCSSFCWHSPAL